jgi:hypothetical protein
MYCILFSTVYISFIGYSFWLYMTVSVEETCNVHEVNIRIWWPPTCYWNSYEKDLTHWARTDPSKECLRQDHYGASWRVLI